MVGSRCLDRLISFTVTAIERASTSTMPGERAFTADFRHARNGILDDNRHRSPCSGDRPMFGYHGARMTQIANVATLSPVIQEIVLHGDRFASERDLRDLAVKIERERQVAQFSRITRSKDREATSLRVRNPDQAPTASR